jgi:hypothetical protein
MYCGTKSIMFKHAYIKNRSSSSSIGATTLSWDSASSTVVEHSQQEGFRVPLPAARPTPNLEESSNHLVALIFGKSLSSHHGNVVTVTVIVIIDSNGNVNAIYTTCGVSSMGLPASNTLWRPSCIGAHRFFLAL